MQLNARAAWTLVALAAAAAVACSSANSGFFGDVSAEPSSSGVATPLPPSTAPFPPGVSCPDDPPSDGESCGPSDGPCEYGSSDDPACNTVARCDPNASRWTVDQATHCPSTCPAHFDEQAPGASCSGTDLCTYLEATCGCAGAVDGAWTTISGGSNNASDAGDGGDEASTDGGDAGASAIGQCQCVRPGHGCPARRPLDGSRCTTAMSCDYGTCVFGVPLSLTCANGRWTAETVTSCP
jgi:hypothetical protein